MGKIDFNESHALFPFFRLFLLVNFPCLFQSPNLFFYHHSSTLTIITFLLLCPVMLYIDLICFDFDLFVSWFLILFVIIYMLAWLSYIIFLYP